jgi:predicted RecA/RadA family phage recombinase
MAEQARLGCELIQTESVPITLADFPTGGYDKGEVIQVGTGLWGFIFSWASDDADSVRYADSVLLITKAPVAFGAKAVGAIAQGAKLYWDNTAKVFTTTASSNPYMGRVRQAALSADTEVEFIFDRTGDI